MAQIPLFEGWLGAKLAGLAAYIGFGVLTLRSKGQGLKAVGLVGRPAQRRLHLRRRLHATGGALVKADPTAYG